MDFINLDISTVASVGALVGVWIAAFELRANQRINQSQFEDSLDQHYRDIVLLSPLTR